MFGSRTTLAQPLKELFKILDEHNWILDLPEKAEELHQGRKRVLSSPVNARRSQLARIAPNSPSRKL
jgi:hypothetical protein